MLIFDCVLVHFVYQFSKCNPADIFFWNFIFIWNNCVGILRKIWHSVCWKNTVFWIINHFTVFVKLRCIAVDSEKYIEFIIKWLFIIHFLPIIILQTSNESFTYFLKYSNCSSIFTIFCITFKCESICSLNQFHLTKCL